MTPKVSKCRHNVKSSPRAHLGAPIASARQANGGPHSAAVERNYPSRLTAGLISRLERRNLISRWKRRNLVGGGNAWHAHFGLNDIIAGRTMRKNRRKGETGIHAIQNGPDVRRRNIIDLSDCTDSTIAIEKLPKSALNPHCLQVVSMSTLEYSRGQHRRRKNIESVGNILG